MFREVWLGNPYPLGATWTSKGVNFALFSENATGVEILLFDELENEKEKLRIPMRQRTDQVWHAFVTDLKPGQLYAYRVYGAYKPDEGHRFNPAKVVIDPYARAIAGPVKWGDEVYGYAIGNPEEDLVPDERDDVANMPKCVVVDSHFDWGDDRPPNTPMYQTIIYETHVRGFSKTWNQLPEELRGTYAGLGSQPAIEYFKNLGITAVELLPVHQHFDDRRLVDMGLSDYWGYNSIGFFAPHYEYSSGGCLGQQVQEFKTMVKNLHAAGIEVILDVVYNHTCEGNHLGPTLCFKGIDNASYYRLVSGNPRYYMDYTGTGNTFDASHPRGLQLIMDSLRYWVQEMHVDGFRFDLASALARELHEVNKLSAFFDVIHQDPVISQVKLIAEPWDVGEGGYQVGNFPVLWSEWNGKYRDTIRRFWKGDEGQIGEFAYRISGSSDLYEFSGKNPTSSINFITAHDGFTLADLVSYNQKHNEANGEGNRDGCENNDSWNCGEEGPTDDPAVNALRRRQMRNFLTTLFLSQGVPMLLGGDEFGRTQHGNNNAYCQDNKLSWYNWDLNEDQQRLQTFTRELIAFRHKHPAFSRPNFFKGREIRGTNIKDIMWLNPDGEEVTDEQWSTGFVRTMAILLSGHLVDVVDFFGRPLKDDTFLLCFNAHYEPIEFSLPLTEDMSWEVVIDTKEETGFVRDVRPEKCITLEARSMVLLVMRKPEQTDLDVVSNLLKARSQARKKPPQPGL